MQPGNPLSHTDPSGYISLHHSSDIDNPHVGTNNYDWRFNEMFQPGYGSGAGQWSHQYNSQWFNFGFLSPSAFDRLYGQGAHQGYQNLLNQKRQRDELYKTILAELFAGGGLHYTFVKLFGRTTIISSEGDPGEITWHMGTILFSNPSAWVFLENLVLISSSGEGGNAANIGGNDPYMNSHGEPVYTMNEFIQANKGLTRNEIINQRQDRSKTFLGSQAGGPNMRYVINPHDGRVLDMRHMLIIGNSPVAVGNLLEGFQWIRGQASGMDPQDFYSNGVGYQFYMQSSSLQRLIAPTTFTDQLNSFFSNPRVIYNW